MSLTREQLEALDNDTLVSLINRAWEVHDIKKGHCTVCHGLRREPGDEEFPCEQCGGSGARSDELGISQLQALGYVVTSVDWNEPSDGQRMWLTLRPDGKGISPMNTSEDAAWEAAATDNAEWGTEGEDD